jgi:hypothetical protein
MKHASHGRKSFAVQCLDAADEPVRARGDGMIFRAMRCDDA